MLGFKHCELAKQSWHLINVTDTHQIGQFFFFFLLLLLRHMHLHIDLVLTVYCGAALYKIPDWAICILSKAAGICLLEITFANNI